MAEASASAAPQAPQAAQAAQASAAAALQASATPQAAHASAAAEASKYSSNRDDDKPEMTFANEDIKKWFIKLFQHGSTDVEGVRKLTGLYPSTPAQMVMSGINSNDRNISIYEWERHWGQGRESQESESINLKEALEQLEGEDKILKMNFFKRYYSWLSSVVMPREREEEQMKIVSNEDEHVLAYGFMLTFGGGLGKLPTQKTASAAQETRTVDMDKLLEFIKEYHVDVGFYSNILSDQTACDLLRAIGYGDSGILKFAKNTFLLNYHGMFFSEQVANQVKSNMIFIKLKITDNKPEFFPSEHRIDEFCTMMDLYRQAIDSEKIRLLKAQMKKARQEEDHTRQAEQETYYNVAQYTDKFFIGGWQNLGLYYNVDNAKATMIFILEKLCSYLNNHTIHRLFFNIVMNKIFLKRYKNKPQDKPVHLGPVMGPRDTRSAPPNVKGMVVEALREGAQRYALSAEQAAAAAADLRPSSPSKQGITLVLPSSVPRGQKKKRDISNDAAAGAAGAAAPAAASASASVESFPDTPDNEFIKAYVDSLNGEALAIFNDHISQNKELVDLFDSILPLKPSESANKRAKTEKKGGKRTKRKKKRRGGRRKTKKKRSRFKRS